MLTQAALAAALAANAPVVVHDSRERSPLASVAAAPVAVPGLDRDRRPAIYGRAVRSREGGAWLQYWMFSPQQHQDRGIVRAGRHAGDWEMVQFRVDDRGRPVQAVYAQHSGAERCSWGTVEQRGGRPVVYAANGSHASYLRAGVRDRMWPDPNDKADGRGIVVRPPGGRSDGDDARLDALGRSVGRRSRPVVHPARAGLTARPGLPAAGALERPRRLGASGQPVPGGLRRGRGVRRRREAHGGRRARRGCRGGRGGRAASPQAPDLKPGSPESGSRRPGVGPASAHDARRGVTLPNT